MTEIKFVKLLKSVFKLNWVSNLQSSLKIFIELVGGIVILWTGGISVINGYNIEDIQLEYLREKITYIPQETFLFSGTIFENLVLGLDKATMDDIIEASKMAQAHDFINDMPTIFIAHRLSTIKNCDMIHLK